MIFTYENVQCWYIDTFLYWIIHMERCQLFPIRCLIPIQALFCRLGPDLLSNNAQIKILLLRSFGKYFVICNYRTKNNLMKSLNAFREYKSTNLKFIYFMSYLQIIITFIKKYCMQLKANCPGNQKMASKFQLTKQFLSYGNCTLGKWALLFLGALTVCKLFIPLFSPSWLLHLLQNPWIH